MKSKAQVSVSAPAWAVIRATEAAQKAIASPLLEAGAIDGARGILINITGSASLKLAEVQEACSIIQSAAHEDANIIFGAVLDEKMKDAVKITVIATGFQRENLPQLARRAVAGAEIVMPEPVPPPPAPVMEPVVSHGSLFRDMPPAPPPPQPEFHLRPVVTIPGQVLVMTK